MRSEKVPFGVSLGSSLIDGVAVEVFSNGNCHFVSAQKTLDGEGRYLGIAYQCVEIVRRYIYLRHGVNLAERWQAGDACDWFGNCERMHLTCIPHQAAQAGDILTFTGGRWGHVGIISGKAGPCLLMTSQNFLNNRNDIDFRLSPEVLRGESAAYNALGTALSLQSVLRLAVL